MNARVVTVVILTTAIVFFLRRNMGIGRHILIFSFVRTEGTGTITY